MIRFSLAPRLPGFKFATAPTAQRIPPSGLQDQKPPAPSTKAPLGEAQKISGFIDWMNASQFAR